MMSLIFYSRKWTYIYITHPHPENIMFACTARIIYTFYRHRKEMRECFDSKNDGPSQNYCYRMIALGCFDTFAMLPIGALQLANSIISIISEDRFRFYQGWDSVHSEMYPRRVPKNVWRMATSWSAFTVQWNKWVYPFLALAFFVLFGLTSNAMAGYRTFFQRLARKAYGKQDVGVEDELPEVAFQNERGTIATNLLITSSK